jgi:hypothetical protein
MRDYLGVVVRESLQDPSLTPPVIASKHGVQWTLLLVRIAAEQLHRELEAVQSNLDRTDCWYAHFFREDELVVVFDDEVFWASTDPPPGVPRGSMAETAVFPMTSSISRRERSQRPRRSLV